MKTKFKITEFTNPSGGTAWRLAGTLRGKRIRENQKPRAKVVAQRQAYEVERLNGVPEGQTVWSTLAHEQNQDAIAAVNILRRSKFQKSLTFAVNYLIEHYREAEHAASIRPLDQTTPPAMGLQIKNGPESRLQSRHNQFAASMR